MARPPVTQQQTGRRPMPCPKADPSAHQSQYLRSGGKGGTCEQATRPAGSRPGPSAAALLPEASQGCPGPACSTRILRLPPRGGGARSGRVGSGHLSRRPPGPPASDCRCLRPLTGQGIAPGALFLATRAGRTVTDAETEAQRQTELCPTRCSPDAQAEPSLSLQACSFQGNRWSPQLALGGTVDDVDGQGFGSPPKAGPLAPPPLDPSNPGARRGAGCGEPGGHRRPRPALARLPPPACSRLRVSRVMMPNPHPGARCHRLGCASGTG